MTASVLLTGATGFVGRAVAINLIKRGIPLRLVLRPGRANTLPVEFANVEITETADLFAESVDWWAQTCAGVSTVVHLAWHVDPADYLTSHKNLTCLSGTLAVAQGAVEAGVSRFVGVGTCFEYDLTYGDLSVETTPLVPLTPYAAAKIAAFQCLDQWFAQTDIAFLWGRLFYLYGQGENQARLVPFLHDRLSRGEEAPLSSGNQVRDFQDVAQAADLLVRAALSKTTGAFNVCSGEGITVRALAEQIADCYGRRDLLRFGARPDKLVDPPRVVGIPTPLVN
ncbi:MAG: NAD-dependent epimerase/dehydratase family protein [Paracoccaceae bacterium]